MVICVRILIFVQVSSDFFPPISESHTSTYFRVVCFRKLFELFGISSYMHLVYNTTTACCETFLFHPKLSFNFFFSLSDEVREKMKNRYLNNPDYNFEKVNHASNACGPLVKWACAQIQYADMLKKVEPLREELNSLEKQAETNKQRGEEVKSLIAQLEQSIASYKEEYAQLIAQAQAIKTDLENVQAKVDRSIALLKSLVIERERWEATSETFRSQMSTIIGDVLLSAAFIAYGEYLFN